MTSEELKKRDLLISHLAQDFDAAIESGNSKIAVDIICAIKEITSLTKKAIA